MSWLDYLPSISFNIKRNIPLRAGSVSYAGKLVTGERLMNLSTAYACIRLKSGITGSLPFGVYERLAGGGMRRVRDHRLDGILHHAPNADQTGAEYWEAATAAIETDGNHYGEKQMIGDRVVGISFWHPNTTTPFRDSNGELKYRHTDRGKTETLPRDKVLHIRGFGNGGDVGFSTISQGRHTFGNAMAQEEASGRFFLKGFMASGFLTPKGRALDDKQIAQLDKIMDDYRGSENAGKIGFLPAEMEHLPLSIKPSDAQLLETRQFSVEEICRWFQIPPFMIGHSGNTTMWGSGIESLMLGFMKFGYQIHLRRIEQRVQRDLMTAADRARFVVKFNVDALLAADAAARSQFYASMVQNGIYTRNEVRSLENRAPVPGADQLTAQLNLTPVQMLGLQDASEQARAAFVAELQQALKEDA